jgi:hypothetical protein
MWDALYVILTVVFFALMLWYVVACARLGRGHGGEAKDV